MRLIDADNIKFTGLTLTDEGGDIYVRLEDVKRAIAQAPTISTEDNNNND